MLRLDDVAMRYGDGPEVLHELNLTLGAGEFVYLMGPTGAGKSSLLRLLGLLQMPSQGKLTLFGRNVASLTRDERAALRRRIGIVFQDPRLLDHLSAYDNVALPLRINGGRDDQIDGVVPELLTWFGLSEVMDNTPPYLSMGQRQLIAVARAVIIRPRLLLCDEPTSSLDGRLAGRLIHLVTQLSKLGTTVVLATHNDNLVARYRHPILQLADGHLKGRRSVSAAVTATRRPTDEPAPPQPPAGPDRTAGPMMDEPRDAAIVRPDPRRRRRHRTRVVRPIPRPRRKRSRNPKSWR